VANGNIAFAAIAAPLDPRLSELDRRILHTIADWPGISSIDEAVQAGVISLRDLCQRTRIDKPHVFYAIARLEEFGYLPDPSIR